MRVSGVLNEPNSLPGGEVDQFRHAPGHQAIQHWLVSESLCRRHLRGPPPGIMIVFITIRVTAAICPSPNLPRCDVRGGDEDVVAPFCHQLQFKYAQLMGTGEFKRRYPDKDGLTASSTATSQQNAILDHRAAALPSSAPSAYF